MRKLAYLLLIILIAIVIVGTLAATNYAGIGDTLYNGAEGTFAMPIRNFIVDNWIGIGSMGFAWIFLASFIQGLIWTVFLTFIIYKLVWQKAIQGKILNKAKPSTVIREEPRDIIATETPASIKTQPEEPKKEEVTVESTS